MHAIATESGCARLLIVLLLKMHALDMAASGICTTLAKDPACWLLVCN